MNKFNTIIGIIVLPLFLSSCATSSDPDNKIRSHGDSAKELGDTWDSGNSMVKKGNALIKKGKEQIEDGEDNLKKGRGLVEKGNEMIEASESKFDQLLRRESIGNSQKGEN